jgi:uncharacterized protein with PQ loop repeat
MALHHLNIRKRIHQKHEPFPHPDRFKRFIDYSVVAIGFLTTVLTVPQVMKIWIEQNVSGVSPITWASFLLYSVFFLIYGIIHKARNIIIIYSVWTFFDFIIVLGVLLHT